MHLHSVAKIRNFCLGMFSSPGLAHSCLQPLQRQRRCQDPFRTHNVPVLAAQLLLGSSADPRKCRLTPQPLTAHSTSNLLCCQSRPTAPPQPLGGVTPPCPLCHVWPGAATSPVLRKCPPLLVSRWTQPLPCSTQQVPQGCQQHQPLSRVVFTTLNPN